MRDLRADALHNALANIGPARQAVHDAAGEHAAAEAAKNGPPRPAVPQSGTLPPSGAQTPPSGDIRGSGGTR